MRYQTGTNDSHWSSHLPTQASRCSRPERCIKECPSTPSKSVTSLRALHTDRRMLTCPPPAQAGRAAWTHIRRALAAKGIVLRPNAMRSMP